MLTVRPIEPRDHAQLVDLAQLTTFGLTTLPKDPDFLAKRIAKSQRSFAHEPDAPGGEQYLFVLDDPQHSRVAGTSGVVSKVGGFEPFYAYRIETSVHESKTLGVRKEVKTLHLLKEHNGPTEIGSLFLSPDYRKGGHGRLISMARFLFMALYPERFDENVIAEMRGVIDANGSSVFWDAVGKHFFEVDFPTADYLSMVDRKFIADLMPTHPIYIPLLPQAAQNVIGKVHEHTEPALRILKDEGFAYSGMVDIFEAGPIMISPREAIRLVRETKRAVIGRIDEGAIDSDAVILCPARGDAGPGAFRACRTAVRELDGGAIAVDRDTANALELAVDARVCFAPLRPRKPAEAQP